MLSVKNCSKFILLVAVMACFATFMSAASETTLIGPCAGDPIKYAIDPDESYGCTVDTPLPAGTKILRVMESVPDGSFYIDLELQDGAVWSETTSQPDVHLTITSYATCPGCPSFFNMAPSQTIVDPVGPEGANVLRLQWDWDTNPITYAAQIEIDISGILFNDCGNMINAADSIGLLVETKEAETHNPIDNADMIDPFIVGAYPFGDINVDDTKAWIDVSSVDPFSDAARVFFVMGAVETDDDFLTADFGATIEMPVGACEDSCLFGEDGLPYEVGDDPDNEFVLQFSIPGDDWDGIVAIQVGPKLWHKEMTDAELHRITFYGNELCMFAGETLAVTITVDGTTSLAERIIQVGALYEGRSLGDPKLVTTWQYNGTLLVAHWLTANEDDPNPANGGNSTGIYKSRMYIYNHKPYEAAVFVTVFQLPVALHDYSPDPLPNAIIANMIPVGTIGGERGLIIRLEDVLDAAGITLPYIVAAGNVGALVTVESADASGTFQVFREDMTMSFGTANMARVNNFSLWDLVAMIPGSWYYPAPY